MLFEITGSPPFKDLVLRDAARADEWHQLKHRLRLGTVLSGRIFARALFGIFFDSGHGFPVLLRVLDFGKPEGNMKWPDDYPSLESETSGQLCDFNDLDSQIVVCRQGIK